MANSILISFQVNYSEDQESSDGDRDALILDYVHGQVESVRNLFDTNIDVSPATAVSSLSGQHNL